MQSIGSVARRWLIIPALLLSLGACGAGTPAAPTSGGAAAPTAQSEPAPTADGQAVEPASGAAASVIEVRIEGGPHAGTYQASSAESTCSQGLAGGENSWGNQYSIDSEDPQEFSSLQLIIDDAEAAASGSEDFMVTVSFGSLLDPSGSYTIRPGEQGSGTVTVEQQGQGALVTIEGETEDGVRINATIQCNEVFRLPGGSGSSDAPAEEGAQVAFDLEIAGGDLPGSVSFSTENAECGYGPNSNSVLIEGLDDAADAWTVEFYDEASGSPLTHLELLIPSGEEAAGGTGTFYLSINDQTYYIENLAGEAVDVGMVTVEDQGDTALITLDARDDSGAAISGSITCSAVVR